MLKQFTIYNDAGTILGSGQVLQEDLELQLANYPADSHLIEEASDPSTDIVDVVNNTVLKNQKPPEPERVKSYLESRYELYPGINEQLDMLWHSMDRGDIPKAEPFYSRIKAVKLAYPKDGSASPDSVVVIDGDAV